MEKTYLNGFTRNILLAKSDEILYVIVDGSSVHTYETMKNIWRKVKNREIELIEMLNIYMQNLQWIPDSIVGAYF